MKLLPIETNRLFLRSLTIKDYQDLLEQRCDPEVSKYISAPMSEQEVLDFVIKYSKPWEAKNEERLAIGLSLKENKKLIGELMFKYKSKDNGVGEIGFRIHKHYQQYGYGYEGSSHLIELLFSRLNLKEIIAFCDVRNTRSIKLLEKLGMTKNKLIIQQHRNYFAYSIKA